ncbi:hypothetical protein CYMTET_21267, partial [Cymbomonas tetramitiformis]
MLYSGTSLKAFQFGTAQLFAEKVVREAPTKLRSQLPITVKITKSSLSKGHAQRGLDFGRSCKNAEALQMSSLSQGTPSIPGTAEVAAKECSLCTSVIAQSIAGATREIAESVDAGADVIELRLDFLAMFNAERDLPKLLAACPVPAIVTYRPDWEGGKYTGPEEERLNVLRMAVALGAAFVDIELKAAEAFFSGPLPPSRQTQIFVSSHNYEVTPDSETLAALASSAWQ